MRHAPFSCAALVTPIAQASAQLAPVAPWGLGNCQERALYQLSWVAGQGSAVSPAGASQELCLRQWKHLYAPTNSMDTKDSCRSLDVEMFMFTSFLLPHGRRDKAIIRRSCLMFECVLSLLSAAVRLFTDHPKHPRGCGSRRPAQGTL